MITHRDTVFEGRRINVEICDVRYPSGYEAKRERIVHPGAVAIVAVDEKDRLLLLRQYRFAVHSVIWEIPAGTLEPDEPPVETARRELIEETGYRAADWSELCSFYTTPGFTNERIVAFLATGLTAGEAAPEAGEEIELKLVPFSDVMTKIQRGEIADGKTLAAVLRYAMMRK